LTFTNTYAPQAITASVMNVVGTKNLEGRDWLDTDEFTVVLEQFTDGVWTKLGEQKIDAKNKTFELSALMDGVTFDEVGEYEFRVRELVGDLPDMDYDEEPKTFTAVVTDEDMDGRLEVGFVRTGLGANADRYDDQYALTILLSNVYVAPTDVKVDIQKTIKNVGNKTIGPEGFEFVLEDAQTQEKIRAVSDANGQTSINLHYGLADDGKTFVYTLTETKGETKGVSYDEREYRITVRVARVGNEMKAAVLVDDVAVEQCLLAFENTYDGDAAVTPPTGDNTNLPFWITMMVLSATACIVLVVFDRRDKKKKA
jgi:pilin isopeptide linkage protein